jgi:hypothetical protein
MLQSFFIAAFELLHGSQDNPAFRDSVYAPAGFWLLITSVLSALFYYYFLNFFWARFSRFWPHWSSVALITMLVNCVIALGIELPIPDLDLFSAASLGLVFIDALYAFLGFLVVSTIIKWGSPNANRTPF